MKLILCIFEQLSGLKINFHKSEIFCFGKAKELEEQYKQFFGCEAGSLPFRYLGVPIHYRKLLNKDWNPVENRFERKLGCWQGKLLSYGDRLVLINSVLTSDSSEFDRFLLHLFTWFLLRFARFSFLTNPYNAKAKKPCFSNVIYRIGALRRGSGRICVQKGRIQHLPPVYTRPKPSKDVDPARYDRSRGAAVVPCGRTIRRRLHRLNTSTSREGPRAIRDTQQPPPPLPIIIRRPDLERRRPRRSPLRSPSISSPPLLIA